MMTEAFRTGPPALLVPVGIVLLTASSWVEIPMLPVPITLQTLAVTLIGALCGWRLGAITVVAWLALGALGLPVLAGGSGGVARFAGPSAGYLCAFPFAAALVGWLTARIASAPALFGALFGVMIAGNALCLTLGAAWLAAAIGPARAIAVGVLPFLIGAVVKSLAGAAIVTLVRRKSPPRPDAPETHRDSP